MHILIKEYVLYVIFFQSSIYIFLKISARFIINEETLFIFLFKIFKLNIDKYVYNMYIDIWIKYQFPYSKGNFLSSLVCKLLSFQFISEFSIIQYFLHCFNILTRFIYYINFE